MTVPANSRVKDAQRYLLTLGLKYVCQRSLLTSPVCAHWRSPFPMPNGASLLAHRGHSYVRPTATASHVSGHLPVCSRAVIDLVNIAHRLRL
jgi:hypothetical protein